MADPIDRPITDRRFEAAGVVLLAAALSFWAAYFIYRSSFVASDGHRYFSLFDDAMISMRYAWNLAHGQGLVWNPGERVEGYTSLLMVGVMSVWTSFLSKGYAVLAVQLIGVPVLLGIAFLGMLHWRELAAGNEVAHRDSFTALAFLGTVAYYPLAYWTLMGMETGLLTLLLLAGSLGSLVYARTGKRTALGGAAVALGLAYLARPDSAPLAALWLPVAALLGPGPKKRNLTAGALAFAGYLLFPILQAVFRLTYYGSFVPLTYTLKLTGMPTLVRLTNGVGFTFPFLKQAIPVYLMAGLGVVLGFSRRKLLLLIPPLELLGYQVAIGGDGWAYWRLVAPGIPYAILLGLAALDHLVDAAGRFASRHALALPSSSSVRSPRQRAGFARSINPPALLALAAIAIILGAFLADFVRTGYSGFGYVQRGLLAIGVLVAFGATILQTHRAKSLMGFAGMLFMLGTLNGGFAKEALLFKPPFLVGNNQSNLEGALSVNAFTTTEASVGVFWAGTLPYYTSRYAVDFLGKNDPYIAHLPADISGSVAWSGMTSVPGHNKYDLNYSILQRRPTYVQGLHWGSQDLTEAARDLYVGIYMPGADGALLRGDPAVLWDAIPPDRLKKSLDQP